jgi:hypothetical protein
MRVLAGGQLPEKLGTLRKRVALKLQEAVDDVLHGLLRLGWVENRWTKNARIGL